MAVEFDPVCFEFKHLRAMHQAIEDGGRHRFIAEVLAPICPRNRCFDNKREHYHD